MSIAADPMMTTEFAIEQGMRELFACAELLDEMRRNNEARQSIIANASDIELVRDRLSRILDDVGGKS